MTSNLAALILIYEKAAITFGNREWGLAAFVFWFWCLAWASASYAPSPNPTLDSTATSTSMLDCVGHEDVNMYIDNFEVPSSWTLFEELVTSCYGDGIGTMNISDPAAVYEGHFGLMLHSNKNMSAFSNHLIAGKNVSNGAYNRFVRYDLYAMLPAAYDLTSQVGPEFSIQNTRNTEVDGGGAATTTAIAGIQHIASRYILDKWNIWVETEPGAPTATWKALPTSVWGNVTEGALGEPTITAGTWWHYNLLVDFDSNEYVSMTVQQAGYRYDSSGGGGLFPMYTANLTGYRIALEPRGFATATVITLEAENMYNNCAAQRTDPQAAFTAFESQMYYDRIHYEELPPTVIPSRNSDADNSQQLCTDSLGQFTLAFEYEFDRHYPSDAYSDKDVVSWDFNIFQGDFSSSSNSYFEKRNADIQAGQLVLRVSTRDSNSSTASNRPYIGAGVVSWPRHAQVYGRWEVEARMPAGYGITGYIG